MRCVEPAVLRRALMEASRYTFNAITVDGESSTNDCVFALASGDSGVRIDEEHYRALVEGLRAVALELSLGIVRGGEGATKLIAITVSGAASQERRGQPRDDRQLAAREDRHSRRRSELGSPGRRRRPCGRDVLAGERQGPHRLARALQHGRPHDELAPQAADYLQGKAWRSKSTSAPAAAGARRCTPAICRQSTCGSTRSIEHNGAGEMMPFLNWTLAH